MHAGSGGSRGERRASVIWVEEGLQSPPQPQPDSLAGLADWRHKQRQLEATKVSAAKAMQPKPTVGSEPDEKVEVVGAEEDEGENLPPVPNKAWEACIEVESAE